MVEEQAKQEIRVKSGDKRVLSSWFSHGSFIDREDGVDIFLRYVG
jgi:hypothetical protein